MNGGVYVEKLSTYEIERIRTVLPRFLFNCIRPGDTVLLKPNWVMESRKGRPDEWEHVITHPAIITAVLHETLDRLCGSGRVVVADGPSTEASYTRLIARYPVPEWEGAARLAGVDFQVIDLRDHEWSTKDDIIVGRKTLPGDPRGKVVFDLRDSASEFYEHRKSRRGYYGADYNTTETNLAHDGLRNMYSVSRTAIEADVFINLPKLKTHRKAGITSCLKNLVGINTYKNFLPHHSEGGPQEGGDQFPNDNLNARIEGPLVSLLKHRVLSRPYLARFLYPLNRAGRVLFGETGDVVRSGNWHGNDTIWRMVLDLNKILLYGNPDGTMRPPVLTNAKRYIGVVDAVVAGEGFGPLQPDPVRMGYILSGSCPAAVDAVSAVLMGFDPKKIPTIERAFRVASWPLSSVTMEGVCVSIGGSDYPLFGVPRCYIVPFVPQSGWTGHIEREWA